ncbi:hypothetical protein B0H11DRAFT_2207922 [Mycena galericulata]|nr:hypothetical protein B0H11DRAFT_2207922 [Mycena galericulata]
MCTPNINVRRLFLYQDSQWVLLIVPRECGGPTQHLKRTHTFPPEMLLEILEYFDPAEAVRVATACRHWHHVAVANSSLWLSVRINETDIEDSDVVQRVLHRSKGCPISVHLDFPSPGSTGPPMNFRKLDRLLWDVVREHMDRCTLLEVHAHKRAWPLIYTALPTQNLPLIRSVFLHNDDVPAHWQTVDSGLHPLPCYIPFHMLYADQLEHAHLRGVSLGNAPFPNLRSLIIEHDFHNIVVDDHGRLNPWLFASATELSFERMCVPAMAAAVGTPAPEPDSTVQSLALRNLCATPNNTVDEDGNLEEYDCSPFFAALPTSRLRYLVIDAWDLDGRIWFDFIGGLPITKAKFPLVEQLVLGSMDFEGMSYANVAVFLGSFPALQVLIISDCIWEDIIVALEMWPSLCPRLPELTLDNGVILRDDLLPFRNYMLDYDLPVGDEDFEEDDYYHDL